MEIESETEKDEILNYDHELPSMWNKDLLNAIGKIADKFKAWIEKIENWLDCLDGDAIIMALSITYLGIFTMK